MRCSLQATFNQRDLTLGISVILTRITCILLCIYQRWASLTFSVSVLSIDMDIWIVNQSAVTRLTPRSVSFSSSPLKQNSFMGFAVGFVGNVGKSVNWNTELFAILHKRKTTHDKISSNFCVVCIYSWLKGWTSWFDTEASHCLPMYSYL